ncbi:MAG: altronate dehydratase family protein [Bacteroidota bacterium]
MADRILKVHSEDNLIVALSDLKNGDLERLNGNEFLVKSDIPAKHKFFSEPISEGGIVRMYGVKVGVTTKDVERGEVATIQNVTHAVNSFDIDKSDFVWQPPENSSLQGLEFDGYHRSDGKVGTANYWLVIPLVFCENRNLQVIKDAMLEELGYSNGKVYDLDVRKLVSLYQSGVSQAGLLEQEILLKGEEQIQKRVFKNVDGIKFLSHEGGCGGTREDSEVLCKLFAGYLNNANVAGATVLSLGCQNAQVSMLQEAINAVNPDFDKPLYILGQQESNSEPEFIAEAVKKTFIGLAEANKLERQPAPLDKLTIGLECGGSDGFSGISANPAVGYFSDLLVSLGGSVILSEFPELNGVEQELIDRSVNSEVAKKFTHLMKSYGQRAKEVGSGFEANPSPGNIKDGLITDAMKSAGAAKKGGTSPVVDVLDYTEQVTKPGLNLLCTPGNDVESTTGLAGSGATIALFTTGLGTPTGNPVSPVIKISSNTKLANKMRDVIDIDTGTIISGEDTIKSKGEEILQYVIDVASGRKTPHAVRLGQDDFIPWKRGVSL